MKRLWACLPMLCGAGLVSAAESCPAVVRVAFFDFSVPPLIYGAGHHFEKTPGYLIDWVRAGLAQGDCAPKVELRRRPGRRAMQELIDGDIDLIASAAVLEERMSIGVFPMHKGKVDARLSFYGDDTSLWKRRDVQGVRWDGVTLTGPPGFRVGIAPATNNELYARRYGWPMDIGRNGPATVEQLLQGRFPVALLSDATVTSFSRAQLDQLVKLQPAINRSLYFSMANKDFHARHPDFVQRHWRGMCLAARANPLGIGQDGMAPCR